MGLTLGAFWPVIKTDVNYIGNHSYWPNFVAAPLKPHGPIIVQGRGKMSDNDLHFIMWCVYERMSKEGKTRTKELFKIEIASEE